MKQLNLPLNQHKTITTRKARKIMKLGKIKKRKTKASKTPIAKNDRDIKREEDLNKKNESNSGINSIQQIKQRLCLLREKLKKYSDNICPMCKKYK